VSIAIWGVRRDIRLKDNQALTSALACADTHVPVFVLDPLLLQAPDLCRSRLPFMVAALRGLDEDLRQLGSRLIVRRGEPEREPAALCTGSESSTGS
jgi:deoxyribodipyrimidine photo-lyase